MASPQASAASSDLPRGTACARTIAALHAASWCFLSPLRTALRSASATSVARRGCAASRQACAWRARSSGVRSVVASCRSFAARARGPVTSSFSTAMGASTSTRVVRSNASRACAAAGPSTPSSSAFASRTEVSGQRTPCGDDASKARQMGTADGRSFLSISVSAMARRASSRSAKSSPAACRRATASSCLPSVSSASAARRLAYGASAHGGPASAFAARARSKSASASAVSAVSPCRRPAA